jgi:hypothetical protein
MARKITDLPVLLAASITNQAEIRVGIDNTGDTTSYQIALDEFLSLVSTDGHQCIRENVSDMVNNWPAVDGKWIRTAGYLTANDGGGNLYQYHETGRPTADGGFYINGAGADDYFEATNKRFANILQFGAKSDGATDNYAVIQAAIDAVEFGGLVVVPEGDYAVATTVLINKAVQFRGTGRANESNEGEGSRLKWTGVAGGTVLQVNDGAAGTSVHGWAISDLTIGGNANSADFGIVIGETSGSFLQTIGTLDNVYVNDCADAGILLNTAQNCIFASVHVNGCDGDGFRAAGGSGTANTTLLFSDCRSSRNDRGFVFQNVTSTTLESCTTEISDREGLLVETTDAADRIYLTANDLHVEGNQTSVPGTGVAQVRTDALAVISPVTDRNRPKVYLNRTRVGTTATNDFDIEISGMDVHVTWPEGEDGSVIRQSSVQETRAYVETRYDPLTGTQPWTFDDSGSATTLATVDYFDHDDSMRETKYISTSPTVGWRLVRSEKLGVMQLSDGHANNNNKAGRIVVPGYDTTEEDTLCLWGSSLSNDNRLYLGGGSSVYNAAETIRFYCAATHDTLQGSEQMRYDSDGLDALSNKIRDLGMLQYDHTNILEPDDGTPDVGAQTMWTSANTVATTITNFINGVDGQILIVRIADAFTTIQSNSGMVIKNGQDFVSDANPTTFLFVRDGSVWYEIARTSETLTPSHNRKAGLETETFSPTMAVDFSADMYDNKRVVLTANVTPTFSTTDTGGHFFWVVQQDATGGFTVTWPGDVVWDGVEGQPLPGANAVTTFDFFFDGTNFIGEN